MLHCQEQKTMFIYYNNMQIKIKKLVSEAVIPIYAKLGDAGMDLTATSKIYDKYGNVSYGTGLAFEIPFGYVGLLFPRSSNSKQDLLLSNSVGVLDSGYRGEVFFKFKPTPVFVSENENSEDCVGFDDDKFDSIEFSSTMENYSDYQIGDKIGQIIILPYPQITFVESNELSDSERGEGGFGSTGK